MRKLPGLARTAKPALAGLLVVWIFLLGLAAADGPLHRSLHQNGSSGPVSCAICLFALGQVDSPAATPVLALAVFVLLAGVLAIRASLPFSFDFLLPPGRGPPCPSHRS